MKHWSPALVGLLMLGSCGAEPAEKRGGEADAGQGGAGGGGRGGGGRSGAGGSAGGGASGSAGMSGGAGGIGGAAGGRDAGSDASSPATDAEGITSRDGGRDDSSSGSDAGVVAGTYECSQFMGPNITADWFTSGFEPAQDKAWNDAWQVKAPHASFANLWADPTNVVWNEPVKSACPGGRKLERIVFVTQLNDWTSTSVPRWKTAIEGGIKTIRAKYPTVKRIDLVTFYRSSDNKPCPSPTETWVPAAHDDAHKEIAAASGGAVVVGPMVRVACNMFAGPPYLTAAGKKLVADEYRKHYEKAP